MISLSPTTAMMVYLGITLAIILGIWISHHYRSKRQKIVLIEQELIVCEYCHFAYLEDKTKPVTRCPQCDAYNKSSSKN